MGGAPDLTLRLRDGGLVSILPSEVVLKARSETSGTHRPNGVFVASGPSIRRGTRVSTLSILDVAPTLLHTLGLPLPADLEGRVPEEMFEPQYLRSYPVTFESPVQKAGAMAAQVPSIDPHMEAEMIGQLWALGYME